MSAREIPNFDLRVATALRQAKEVATNTDRPVDLVLAAWHQDFEDQLAICEKATELAASEEETT